MSTTKPDIYQKVTDRILAAIDSEHGQWSPPWYTLGQSALTPINLISRKAYRGINVPLLWIGADQGGYTSGLWATYKQWAEKGAQVRKGEKATQIVFWKSFTKENEEGE